MTNELDELSEANPIRPEQLFGAVAIDRETLLATFEADGEPRRVRILRSVPAGSAARVGYVGAGLLVAAGFAAIALAGVGDLSEDRAVAEPGTDTVPEIGEDTVPVVEVPEIDPPGSTDEAEPPIASVGDATQAVVADDEVGEAASADETTETVESAPDAPNLTRPAIDGPFNPETDLLSLHYDHAPNRDDGMSTVAALEIVTWLRIEPHVVSGAYGTNKASFDPASAAVMAAAWGEGNWVDAHADRALAIRTTADRWLAAIDGGGSVWVAEGGQSDLTAAVVRQLKARRPNLDTAALIHVVQHSKLNEGATSGGELGYVKATTEYLKIADGNEANATANLRLQSPTFVAAALAGQNAAAWEAAFAYKDPATLDFSDTVEVLHIIGVGPGQVADPSAFAAYFMG